MYEKIPEELKALPNWVSFRLLPDEKRGKPRKVPFNAGTGEPAKSNDPSTWCDFETAASAEGYSGIGFMFSESPYFGVDIDDVADELPKFMAGEPGLLSDFVDTLQSYTEKSTSGNGIHIICRGNLPKGGRRKGNVEMYESGRFFVMTGQSVSRYTDIAECTESIKALHERYIGSGKLNQADSSDNPNQARSSEVLNQSDMSVGELLKAISRSKSAEKFGRLWRGDISGYTSHSEADLAMCCHLAFWCRKDPVKMDEMFRMSGLMRDKWDSKRGDRTYGAMVIEKAIESCAEVFTPSKGYHVVIGDKERRLRIYTLDDTGNSERMYDLFGDWLRYSYVDRRWLYYNGRNWEYDREGVVEKAAAKSVGFMYDEEELWAEKYGEDSEELENFLKWRKTSRSNKSKKAMIAEVAHKLALLPEEMDKDKYLLNLMNGYLDLASGEFHEHDPERYMTKIVPVEYDPAADCPVWKEFLDTVFAGDEDLIRYVQKAVGYSLTGDTSEQCVFFLYGTGSNGKSTFLSTIRQICGGYAANVQPETIMVRQLASQGANSDIARLKSARFVTSTEPNEGMRLNEGLIKQLSGEDPVTARKLYGDEFEFLPEFKLWMGTNHKPIIRGTDTGIWRRVHMIPFEVRIPDEKKDKHLSERFRGESSGILNWAVEGYKLYKAEGLGMPSAVYKAVAEYRHEMDSISQFLEECTEPGGDVPANLLYAAYKDWARSGEQYVHTSTKFGREIASRYMRLKGKSNYIYQGLHLCVQM